MVWHIKRSILWFRRRVWDSLGPGLIAGAADDDPSGVATYSVAGADVKLMHGQPSSTIGKTVVGIVAAAMFAAAVAMILI